MNKNKGMAYASLAIAFVLFNVVAFIIPSVKASAFWVAYVFTDIAFVLQIAIWESAFNDTKILRSKFLGISLISVGLIYLIIQIIAFAIFMALPLTASWSAFVSCTLILGLSAICLIGTEVAKEEINRIEEKVEKKVFYIKSLQVDVEMLAGTETDTATKSALMQLAERIRYSDPMSDEQLTDIERQITEEITKLKSSTDKAKIINELNSLLDERNKKSKILK